MMSYDLCVKINETFGVSNPPGAVGARWGAGLEQNDRTDIEKAVLTPGAIGIKFKPNPRQKSDHPHFFTVRRDAAGVIWGQAKTHPCCNRCRFVSFGSFGHRFDGECLLDM